MRRRDRRRTSNLQSLRLLRLLRVSLMKLRGEPRDLAAHGVAMQLAFAGGLVERADSGAQFFLRRAGVGGSNRFRCGFNGGTDLRPGRAVMFSALEVLPMTLLCRRVNRNMRHNPS